MLRTIVQSGNSLMNKGSVCRSVLKKLRQRSSCVLAAKVHSGASDKASSASASAQPISHFEAIRGRGFYLDDIYQHVKGSVVSEVKVLEEGKMVQITWEDGHISRFHSIWLRHNCHCGECLPCTTTVLVDFSKIDLDLRVTSIKMEGDDVIVFEWKGQAEESYHEGPILTKFLRYNCYSEASQAERSAQRAMKFDGDMTIPTVDYEEVSASDEGLYKWLLALSNKGICLVKNVPTERGTVRKAAELLGPLQNSTYGEVFNVESSPKPMNAAYTGVGLLAHMDMIHYESPPGIQLLHCLEFDKTIKGGSNFFVDVHEAAHKMREQHPDLFEILTRVPSCASTLDYLRDYQTDIRIQRPIITVNHRNEIVSVLWQPMSIAPLQVSEKDVEDFYKAYKVLYTLVHYPEAEYSHRLQPGDMISMNNRRVLHGRKEYTETGRRLLQGCYVNISDFQSKVRIFHNKLGNGCWPTRSGAIDWQ